MVFKRNSIFHIPFEADLCQYEILDENDTQNLMTHDLMKFHDKIIVARLKWFISLFTDKAG